MPFEHGLDGAWEPETHLLPLPFNSCCEDCLFEAWERMTYGGLGLHPGQKVEYVLHPPTRHIPFVWSGVKIVHLPGESLVTR